MFKVWGTYCLALLILISGCATTNHDEPVAAVGNNVLYQSDLDEIIPNNISKEDSLLLASDYVTKWVKQELLIKKADENLSVDQKDLSKELEAYRNSLIIYKYKNELIKQRMDTVVTSEQIENYYNAHQADFNLSNSIVKAIFVKIPADLANPELVKKLVADSSSEGLDELRDYCGQYAKKVNISVEDWIYFRVLEKNFPIKFENEHNFLTRKNLYELNDSNYYYLVRIHDYKLANDLAPIEFVENNIKNLILNQRKIKFLKEIEENIYTEGIRQKKFKIYEQKAK